MAPRSWGWLWADDGPAPAKLFENGPVLWGIIGAGVLLALLALAFLTRKKSKNIDPEEGMSEDLRTYPPPPAQTPPKQLTVQGQPVRVRLVVLAPVGRQQVAADGDVEPILDKVVRGMGLAARYDQPQVRAWPLGLSNTGFVPMFFRRVVRPQLAGTPSNWILLAGQARAGAQQLLLGLALWSAEPTTMGNIPVKPDEWNTLLHVEAVG
jgi:hypothetical protein